MNDTSLMNDASAITDIEWRAASVDTALFKLLDRLQREKRSLTVREPQRFSGGARTPARRHEQSIMQAIMSRASSCLRRKRG